MTRQEAQLRSDVRAGDLGAIVRLHGVTYAREHGFDARFEAYVAGALAEFVARGSDRERLFLADRAGEIVGCSAIVAAGPGVAQFRWFLVAPEARGAGLGRRLLDEALDFARASGYDTVTLWTVNALEAATRLHRAAGFVKVEEKPGSDWGVPVLEERYELALAGPARGA